jgi:hypothetical protein
VAISQRSGWRSRSQAGRAPRPQSPASRAPKRRPPSAAYADGADRGSTFRVCRCSGCVGQPSAHPARAVIDQRNSAAPMWDAEGGGVVTARRATGHRVLTTGRFGFGTPSVVVSSRCCTVTITMFGGGVVTGRAAAGYRAGRPGSSDLGYRIQHRGHRYRRPYRGRRQRVLVSRRQASRLCFAGRGQPGMGCDHQHWGPFGQCPSPGFPGTECRGTAQRLVAKLRPLVRF